MIRLHREEGSYAKPASCRANLRGLLSLSAIWFNVFHVPSEDLECRVPIDLQVRAEVCLLSAVDLCELNVLLLQLGGGLFIFRCQGLAVTAPWCKNCNAKRKWSAARNKNIDDGNADRWQDAAKVIPPATTDWVDALDGGGIQRYSTGQHTFSKNQIILVYERLKCVLLQLRDIAGSHRGSGDQKPKGGRPQRPHFVG